MKGQTKGTLGGEIAVEQDQPVQTLCQAGKEPHAYSSHSVPGSKLDWIKQCYICGHYDNEDIDAQINALIENSNQEAWIDEIGRFPNSIYAKKCGCLSCKQQLKRYAQLRRVPVGGKDGS